VIPAIREPYAFRVARQRAAVGRREVAVTPPGSPEPPSPLLNTTPFDMSSGTALHYHL